MIEKYVKLFALVLPVTSILLIPQIQGTTPGLLMALFSPFIVLTTKKNNNRYYWNGIIIFATIFTFFFLASQLSLILGGGGPRGNLVLIRQGPLDPMRSTIFTQGLYLASGYFTYRLFTSYYCEDLDRYIIAGGVLLAAIGFAEWYYFLATGNDFGFISNRSFGENGDRSASQFQTIYIMGHSLLRLKSLTGEPSMYALTVFPYFVFCIARRKYIISIFLFTTLLLSTSTSALLAIVSFGLMIAIFYKKGLTTKAIYFTLLFFFLGILTLFFKDVLVQMVIEKLMLENVSGVDRFFNIRTNMEYWLKSNISIKMFGIGWGTIRSTDMLMTLLINTGICGLIVWLFLFLKPTTKVRRNDSAPFILNLGMITVLILLLVAIPEYAYLTTWMFLGILYHMTQPKTQLAKTPCE